MGEFVVLCENYGAQWEERIYLSLFVLHQFAPHYHPSCFTPMRLINLCQQREHFFSFIPKRSYLIYRDHLCVLSVMHISLHTRTLSSSAVVLSGRKCLSLLHSESHLLFHVICHPLSILHSLGFFSLPSFLLSSSALSQMSYCSHPPI